MKRLKKIARLLPALIICILLSACSSCGEGKVIYRTAAEADEETVRANAAELARAIGWEAPDDRIMAAAEFVTKAGVTKVNEAFSMFTNYNVIIQFKGADGQYTLTLSTGLKFQKLELKDGGIIELNE